MVIEFEAKFGWVNMRGHRSSVTIHHKSIIHPFNVVGELSVEPESHPPSRSLDPCCRFLDGGSKGDDDDDQKGVEASHPVAEKSSSLCV